jgi:hypothetical protein
MNKLSISDPTVKVSAQIHEREYSGRWFLKAKYANESPLEEN